MKPKIKIIIVDDHPVVVRGLKNLPGEKFTVVADFGTGAELLQFLKEKTADLILLDISLPDESGIDLCLKIKRKNPEIKVLMLSNRSERSSILQSLKNGASGYLLKNASMDELTTCIESATLGNIVFDEEVKKIMSRPGQNDLSEPPKLTRREKEILKLLSSGMTSQSIADALFLSILTVETHRKNLLQKFGAKNSAEMVKFAIAQDLL